jgi:predicted nucleic acid-binding Zn ribbon protein
MAKKVRSLRPYSEILADARERERKATLLIAYLSLALAIFGIYLAGIAVGSR